MAQSDANLFVNIQGVTYQHWNKTEPTLRNLSLQIPRGTLNVLVGPSGSGKSTLCDLLNGVIPHLYGGELEGDVWVDGVNTRGAEVKDLSQKVGHVFQDPESMFATLHVDDEIAFGPENLRLDPERITKRVEELLRFTGLEDRRTSLVWNLSGGQIQKLGLATVLAMNPEMIVLDEPTSNLDPAATHSVHQMVLTLRDQGTTVLLVTRELDEFLAEADQLIVLDAGRVVASGVPRDVLRGHGSYLIHSLGVWLPETTEIGIALEQAGALAAGVPITVEETTNALVQSGVLLTAQPATAPPVEQQPMETGRASVTARDLHYVYPGGTEALKGVSLKIRDGELLAIVGRNGAGKSTLAKLLVGLLEPQTGTLTLFGKEAENWKVQELANEIALVFQNPEHQFLTDTVAEEIEYSLMAQGVSNREEIQRRVHDTLELLGLENTGELHPFSLSAGLKRRLGVATMLIGEPNVLLVDEPTYGQDKQMTETLMALMMDIRSRGIAVVMITHDMRLVQEYAERVIVMNDGQILFDGDSAELFRRDDLLRAANLRPTLLHEVLRRLEAKGMAPSTRIRRTSDLLDALGLNRVGVSSYGG
jgi:energy-coupling factor transporter ATP-binding protein EcfA2